MNENERRKREGAVGSGVALSNPSPNVLFKSYVADRPGHTDRLRAAEIVLDISITLAHPVRKVWPIFKDFTLWMSRFGFVWDGVPADNEDKFVYLGNKLGANDLKYALEDAVRPAYIVRKVVPERLLYFDSLPSPIAGKDGVWTGHNVMTLFEEGKQTTIVIVMEHTWYSETLSIDELRAEGRGVLESGLQFWRDYFIPDLVSAVQSRGSNK